MLSLCCTVLLCSVFVPAFVYGHDPECFPVTEMKCFSDCGFNPYEIAEDVDTGCRVCKCMCGDREKWLKARCEVSGCQRYVKSKLGCNTCKMCEVRCTKSCGDRGYRTDEAGNTMCECNCPKRLHECNLPSHCIRIQLDKQGCPTCQCTEYACPSLEQARWDCRNKEGMVDCDDLAKDPATGCYVCRCNRKFTCPKLCDVNKCGHHSFALDKNGCPFEDCRCKCPEFRCPMYKHFCKYGYELDRFGCPTCTCARKYCPALDCKLECEFGYVQGPDGCDVCHCRGEEVTLTDVCPDYGCPNSSCELSDRKLDSQGCPTCECCPKERMEKCRGLNCGLGYWADQDGCPLCRCVKSEKESCDCECYNYAK